MERSAELRELVFKWYEAYSNGDISFVKNFQSCQDGVLGIGTDPTEWWTDCETINKMNETQMQAMPEVKIVPGDVLAYSEGTVGWIADRARWKFPDGTEIPIRITAVLHKENGEWKMVQLHGSFGVSNEDTFFAEAFPQ